MIPSSFVLLEALPLTPNGKVDRRALPAPDSTYRAFGDTYVAPKTPVEQQIAQIWEEVLHLTQVGRHDNFFDLGGHSLLATQVMARIRTSLQTDVPLRTLFESPTIAGLATVLDQSHVAPEDTEHLGILLDELEVLSEEEAQARLDKEI
jgi:hypothetical protein